MYPLVESLNITEYKILNLTYHNNRVNAARKELWPDIAHINLFDFVPFQKIPSPDTIKCRILIGKDDIQTSFELYKPKPIRSLQLVYDSHIDYHLKWTRREALTQLYHLRGSCDDILIIKNEWVTDTYYCNVAFHRNREWLTPHQPLLKGTQRQYLLDQGVIKEYPIKIHDIKQFTEIKLFNAMLPWDRGPLIPISRIQA